MAEPPARFGFSIVQETTLLDREKDPGPGTDIGFTVHDYIELLVWISFFVVLLCTYVSLKK